MRDVTFEWPAEAPNPLSPDGSISASGQSGRDLDRKLAVGLEGGFPEWRRDRLPVQTR
jgi:hypothetical protein